MAWFTLSRGSHGRCNYFKTDKDKKWYFVETEFLQLGTGILWPVESYIGTEDEDRNTQKVHCNLCKLKKKF